MRAQPECVVCLYDQALRAAKIVTDDPDMQAEILRRVSRCVADSDVRRMNPAKLSQPSYDCITAVTGVIDPYEAIKKECNKVAQSLVPDLRELLDDSEDKLNTALHIAAVGNTIDLGAGHEFDIEKDVLSAVKTDFGHNDVEQLRGEIKSGRKILYLGDNAGEIVFDMLLVEQLLDMELDVTFTVKSGPIINDAMMNDAEDVGMTELVKVIETGSNDIGVNWDNASDEFKSAFESADIILGKGHGNYETCNDLPGNIYFLLKAKCDIVADSLGVKKGEIVFKKK
ncbi:hypothetical protein BVX94_03510 [bacterium B17]|nr:hypothetical protein BVX94_03510 [bacterium B17]